MDSEKRNDKIFDEIAEEVLCAMADIYYMTRSAREECFGACSLDEIFHDMSARDIMKRYREYINKSDTKVSALRGWLIEYWYYGFRYRGVVLDIKNSDTILSILDEDGNVVEIDITKNDIEIEPIKEFLEIDKIVNAMYK